KDYENAVKLYSSAIELNPTNAIYYGNRSLAYLRTECYGYALADATRAVQLDAKYVKGYYRRAASNMALGKFRAALRDYETVVKVRPNDKDAKLKYQECHRIVKQKAFERAIASDEHKRSVVDSLDIESMNPLVVPRHGVVSPLSRVPCGVQGPVLCHRATSPVPNPCSLSPVPPGVILCPMSPIPVSLGVSHPELWWCPQTLGQCPQAWALSPCPWQCPQALGSVPRPRQCPQALSSVPRLQAMSPNPGHCPRVPSGNHETDNMNQIYGFEGEVKAKYTAQMFALFSEVFEWLPLAQCINGKVLIMHGGLFSEDGVTLDDIRKIERNRQPPDSGGTGTPPQDVPKNGRSVSKRGVSCQFGPDVTKRFLERNRLELIIRSHEVKPEGYEVAHDGRCVTVFSAPNYCDQMGNKGSYIHLRGSDLRPDFHQFTAV
ncbi:PPP5 phosphatase, partial [Hylia prasina]|nr:PPP5 phosphatase [Hylia prasina]